MYRFQAVPHIGPVSYTHLISSYSRNAQGVKMMDLEKGDKVAALAIVDTVSDEEKETENAK